MAEAIANMRDTEAELLHSFRAYESGIAYGNARRTAVFAAVFMLVASSLDWVIVADHGFNFLMIRGVCAILLGGIFWYLGKTREPVTPTLFPKESHFFH